MRLDRPSSSDRRSDFGLVFAPEKGLLMLGGHRADLAEGWGNRAVLEAYVDLAGKCRGDRLSDLVEVRQADVDALTRALDLDSDDLHALMEEVLGATRDEAVRLVARLREVRLIGGIAAAATGAALAGAIVVGTMGGGSAPAPVKADHVAMKASVETTTPAPTATTETPTTEAPTPDPDSITETPDGVGLIPALQEEADGTGLIEPATTEQPPGN